MFHFHNFMKPQPHNYTWHKIGPPLFRKRLISGELSKPHGDLLRRRTHDGRWEYMQLPETDEDFAIRQW